MKKTATLSKVRSNRLKYLKLFPLFIHDIDRTTDSDEHWPCFEAKFVDDLIVIPDVEQGEKLFRYGSFGKDEFARTKTQASPSAPLMKVPNNRQHYEKPYRLRSVLLDENNSDAMEIDDQTSEFEKCFVEELNAKLFPTSIDQVRKQSHDACQTILDQTRLDSSSNTVVPFVSINEEQLPSKLIVYENVYLLPEEALFLQHALGCLQVRDDSNAILSLEDLWTRLIAQDPRLPIKYAVYYQLRSAGWIVKSGLKFGCDFMLYRFGPGYNHADYCVSIENFWRHNSCSWSFVSGLNRACLNARKVLLITHVNLPAINSEQLEEFLQQTTVQTVEFQRWTPTKSQSSELAT